MTPSTVKPDRPSSSAAPASREMVDRLRRLVDSNSARWRRLVLLECLGLCVAVLLGYLLLFFFLDTRMHLPTWGRALVSLGFIGGVLGLAVRSHRRWRGLHLTADAVALAVEKRTVGGVQNRFINAVQLARDDSSELGQAVVEENYRRLQELTLPRAGQGRPALICLGLAVAVLGVGAAFWSLQPDEFANAAQRILMPFADVDPIYRTTLAVEPGDVEGAGNIEVTITVRGERPANLTILSNVQGRRGAEVVPITGDVVKYTFHAVDQSMTYAVKGGDFTSPTYRIDVPAPALLSLLRVHFHYPTYTKLPEKSVERAGGDLEALRGSSARVVFVFDQPADEVVMLLERSASARKPEPHVVGQSLMPLAELAFRCFPPPPPESLTKRIPLERITPTEYRGDLVFEDVVSYKLETRRANKPSHKSPAYALRILSDQEPRLDLTGLDRTTEVQVDSKLSLRITATDDFGLEKVGLFVRRPSALKAEDEGWEAVVAWPVGGETAFRQAHELDMSALKVTEGEKVELALRGVDTDPLKAGRWCNGSIYTLVAGGEGAALQVQYEQILKTEKELKELIGAQKKLQEAADDWVKKLDGAGGLRWDDMKNLDALHAALKEQGSEQEKTQKTAGQIARDTVAQAGNLRLSIGMLADTEMLRAGRALDSVPTQDTPQAKRKALADARTTQLRTIKSLEEIAEQYAAFRSDWEMANMIPFVQMLAERQAKMATQSRQYAEQPAEKRPASLPEAVARRQVKILALCQLIRPAFKGLAEKVIETEPGLASAFTGAAASLGADGLKASLHLAADESKAGNWAAAADQQTAAARELAAIHGKLRKAQLDAAQAALKALQDKARSDVEAQKLLEKLNPGNDEKVMKDVPGDLKIEEIIHMQEIAQKKGTGKEQKQVSNLAFSEEDLKLLDTGKAGQGQDIGILKLASTPDKSSLSFPNIANTEANKVKPFIHEKFDDLVGKLLDEADSLGTKYETLTKNYAGMHGDPGEISKQGGSVNSTSADSATGNMKPNDNHSAGVSRPGRQGGRAGGMIVGDTTINRKGRDKPLEGHERVPDVDGMLKEKKSDEMQKETSTGVGGKRVQSDDTKFSLSDAGKWTDDMAKRMHDPQKKNYIVERADGKLDPKVAEMMRDLESKQEQVIERIKAVKKELRNLYLPTDHLDEMVKELQGNLDRLKERPDADVFRQQLQALERLHGTMKVFRGANAGFQASVPRQQAVRGRVLDEPARPTIPGYEEAVKRYYEKLASQ